MRIQHSLVAAAAVLMAWAGPAAAATVFNGLQLQGVTVNGATYDVTLLDGSFNSVFPTANLTFSTSADALAAAQAIAARSEFQALLPSAGPSFGGVLVPFSAFKGTVFDTAVAGGTLGASISTGTRSDNVSDYGFPLTFATFAVAPGVPEPATWGLMLTGFLGAGAAIRASRRRTAATAA